jgi:hypothetical protein
MELSRRDYLAGQCLSGILAKSFDSTVCINTFENAVRYSVVLADELIRRLDEPPPNKVEPAQTVPEKKQEQLAPGLRVETVEAPVSGGLDIGSLLKDFK